MNKLIKLVVLFLFLGQFGYSQLNVFTLNVKKTDETCTGNGSLTFNVSNISAGATIIYSIYLFPNLITPITTLTTNTFTGLSNGNYRVVALQSLGNLSNSQQQDIVINNLIIPVSYTLTGQNITCTTTGSITVNITQGTPLSYEIISGPIIVPPQSSTFFNNLVAGNYNVRVNDTCGDGVVQSFTITTIPNIANFTVATSSTICALIDCNTLALNFSVVSSTNTTLVYPLTIVITVSPPNSGTPIVLNQTISSGSTGEYLGNINIPFYHNQLYSYSISVTNGCGNVVTLNNTPILKKLTLTLSQQLPGVCSRKLKLDLCNFFGAYTVNFISFPSGFNPTTFNALHPGPFTSSFTEYVANGSSQLPIGIYVISVTDSCGRTAQSQITLTKSPPDYVVQPSNNPCNPSFILRIPNNGPPINTLILTQAPSSLNYSLPLNLTSQIVGGVYQMTLLVQGTYTFTGTNICGDSFSFDIIIPPLIPPTLTPSGSSTAGCNSFNGIASILLNGLPFLATVTLLQAPPNYVGTLPQNVSQFIVVTDKKKFFMQNIPAGNYVFSVTDTCGTIYNPVNVIVPPSSTQIVVVPLFIKGCELNYTSLRLLVPGTFLQQVIITLAPSSFNQTLPFNVSFNINNINGAFYMNSLPEGNYNFFVKDICNNEKNLTLFIPGYTITNTINVQANCGSFNLDMQHIVNEEYYHSYWLQKFNPNINQWVNPFTNVVYSGGLPTVLNSYQLQNLVINYNIASEGTFRIIKSHSQYENGSPALQLCNDVIKTFDFNDDLKINSANTFPCSNGVNEVIVGANGVAPLTFKITSKNGASFIINNGTSNIFTGLAQALYNFQVTDVCGNIVNRIFDINLLPEPAITPVNLCDGQVGQLSVQAISYLSYQWWKGTDTATILSTTNVLNFNPFSATSSPGTYYVRIYSTNPLSCANKIVSYLVPSVSNPNAGQNKELIVCGSSSSIDLFSILTPPFDAGGTWTETTTSNSLNGNIWTPTSVNYGIYIFKYTVSGFCGVTDDATITINFKQGPPIPVISSVPNICESETINLNIPPILNSTYLWSGPNNFTSTSQNVSITNATMLNAGIYTVKAFLNGCESMGNYEIIINPSPNFKIEQGCLNSVFSLNVIPIDNSFVSDQVTYNWVGPNGFTSSLNPVNLSGLSAGNYQVTVSNVENCDVIKSVIVLSTLCSIANVITPNGDGSNEFFELSGLDVSNLQIFSRWGRLVYEKDNYTNQWNGQNMKNGRLPDSTYYYFIKLTTGEELHGWILLAYNSN